MPKILDRLVGQLTSKGMLRDKAFAVATKQQQKAGNLKPGTQELTKQGERRQDLGAAGRAKDRASKYSGKHAAGDYAYNPRTNTATLKRK